MKADQCVLSPVDKLQLTHALTDVFFFLQCSLNSSVTLLTRGSITHVCVIILTYAILYISEIVDKGQSVKSE